MKRKPAKSVLRTKTNQKIAMRYQVHLNLVTLWGNQLQNHVVVPFEQEGKDKDAEEATCNLVL